MPFGTAALRARALQVPTNVVFELRRLDTGGLVHRYSSEGAALAFVRDVVRIVGREQAACFALDEADSEGNAIRLADGVELVRRAVQDRAL